MDAREDKLRTVVVTTLELSPDQYSSDLSFGEVSTWDSLGHVNLIFSIEDNFGIKFDSAEIPKLKSVRHIRDAIARRLT